MFGHPRLLPELPPKVAKTPSCPVLPRTAGSSAFLSQAEGLRFSCDIYIYIQCINMCILCISHKCVYVCVYIYTPSWHITYYIYTYTYTYYIIYIVVYPLVEYQAKPQCHRWFWALFVAIRTAGFSEIWIKGFCFTIQTATASTIPKNPCGPCAVKCKTQKEESNPFKKI